MWSGMRASTGRGICLHLPRNVRDKEKFSGAKNFNRDLYEIKKKSGLLNYSHQKKPAPASGQNKIK
jgi:hypothetical protein